LLLLQAIATESILWSPFGTSTFEFGTIINGDSDGWFLQRTTLVNLVEGFYDILKNNRRFDRQKHQLSWNELDCIYLLTGVRHATQLRHPSYDTRHQKRRRKRNQLIDLPYWVAPPLVLDESVHDLMPACIIYCCCAAVSHGPLHRVKMSLTHAAVPSELPTIVMIRSGP